MRPMDPFGHMERIQVEIEDFMEDIDRDPFGRSGFPMFSPMSSMAALGSSSFNNSNNGRWISESFMTSTVNGVTQTIRKRTDVDVSLSCQQFFVVLILYVGQRTCYSYVPRWSRSSHYQWSRAAACWLSTLHRPTKKQTHDVFRAWASVPISSKFAL